MYNVVLLYIYLHVYVIWYKIKMETEKKKKKRITFLCNIYSLTPQLYIAKLGFAGGVNLFSFFWSKT